METASCLHVTHNGGPVKAMIDGRDQLSPIEEGLRELDAAQLAGVFRRTVVEPSCLRNPTTTRPAVPFFASWRHFGLPAAACLALAFGVGAFLFNHELNTVRRTLPGAACIVEGAVPKTEFALCFGGPGSGQMPECKVFDCDTDGDVDLVDYASYQVAIVHHASR